MLFKKLIYSSFKLIITLLLYIKNSTIQNLKRLLNFAVNFILRRGQPFTINDLNDDELMAVFDYFTLEELSDLSKVCDRWRTLVRRSYRKQKTIQFTRMFGLIFDECCDSNQKLRVSEKSRSVIVLNDNSDHISLMSGIIAKCVNLKSINLVGVYFTSDYSPIKFLTDYCKADLMHCNLAHIYNKEIMRKIGCDARILIPREEMLSFVTKFPNIVHFNAYRSWIRFTESSLTALFIGLKNLEFIAFAKESQCVSDSFDNIIDGNYLKHINRGVKTIRITQNILGTNGLHYLTERLTNLQQLKINTIDCIEQLRLICESFAATLKCISFEFCIPVEHVIESFRLLAMLENLEEIDIAMNDETETTTDSCFLELMRRTPHMKSIMFRIRVTNISLQCLHIYWPDLKKLRVKPKIGSVINADTVRSIIKLKNLSHLDLNDSELGDEDVLTIIRSLNSLRYLNLTGTRVTVRSLESYAEKAELSPSETFVVILNRTSIVMSTVKSVLHLPSNLLTQ